MFELELDFQRKNKLEELHYIAILLKYKVAQIIFLIFWSGSCGSKSSLLSFSDPSDTEMNFELAKLKAARDVPTEQQTY